jgi:dTDP-4-dehydrorhamnose reductase
MIYILGSKGIISKNIKSIFKKNCVVVSRAISKKYLKTYVFSKKFNKKKDPLLCNVKGNDTIIILSNLGTIMQYELKKNFIFFINCLKNNLLRNLSSDTRVIFFSSDYVFSGKNKIYHDYSRTKPINKYGLSKKIIEDFIRKNFNNHLILRVPKIYSLNLKYNSFVSDFFKSKNNIPVLDDQNICLMKIEDFIIILKKIFLYKDLKGTFNLPSNYCGSRFNFLIKIMKKNNYFKKIKKISIKDLKIKIPKNLRLSTNLYKKIKYKYSKINLKLVNA